MILVKWFRLFQSSEAVQKRYFLQSEQQNGSLGSNTWLKLGKFCLNSLLDRKRTSRKGLGDFLSEIKASEHQTARNRKRKQSLEAYLVDKSGVCWWRMLLEQWIRTLSYLSSPDISRNAGLLTLMRCLRRRFRGMGEGKGRAPLKALQEK